MLIWRLSFVKRNKWIKSYCYLLCYFRSRKRRTSSSQDDASNLKDSQMDECSAALVLMSLSCSPHSPNLHGMNLKLFIKYKHKISSKIIILFGNDNFIPSRQTNLYLQLTYQKKYLSKFVMTLRVYVPTKSNTCFKHHIMIQLSSVSLFIIII